MQISRIRLSDKTSRLHPRHVVPKRSQADEPEVPVQVREWISVPRWLFQERRLSLTLRLTFAVQRSCELEHLATTSQPSFVCLLLSKAHKVSPARAPSVSMTVSKKPLRSSAEQALASAAHMPTKDMLTASSVNNLFSRVPSLSATGTFRPGVWTRMSPVGGSAALRGPGSPSAGLGKP